MPPPAAPPEAPPATFTPAEVAPGYEATQAVPAVDATQAQQPAPSGWDTPGQAPPAQAPQAPESSGRPIGAIVAGVGGLGMLIGSLLEWAAPSVDPAADVSGQLARLGLAANDTLEVPSIGALSSESNSVGVLIAGLVVLACAALMFTGRQNRVVTLVAIAAGVIGLGLAAYSFIDLSDLGVTVNGQEIAGISFDIGIGLWIALFGGLVAAIGGILSLRD